MPESWWNIIGRGLFLLAIKTLMGIDRAYVLTLLRIGNSFAEAQPTAFGIALRGSRIEFPREHKGPEDQLNLPLE